MAVLRHALPALAIVSAAYAQSCSNAATVTVTNTADAAQFTACRTYTGSVAIATDASGTIALNGVRSITGDLSSTGSTNVTGISADSLQSVGGTWTLSNLQNLNTLAFTALTSVGNLDFEGLPNLNTLNFGATLQSAGQLNIQNTFLSTLNGINMQQVNSIYIANNRLLQDISFQVASLRGTLNVESNGDKLTCAFPNLLTAQNITFRNVPSISIPSLANTTGSLGFYENSITSINAPNLTTVGGTLAINTNMQLTNISMPSLTKVSGGLQVQNNTLLDSVVFPALQVVSGATDMYGAFTTVSLPALKDNRGAFNIQSTGSINSSCAVFNGQRGASNVIKGKYTCMGDLNNPQSATGTGSSATSTKKSEAGDVRINTAALGSLGVIAAVFGLL